MLRCLEGFLHNKKRLLAIRDNYFFPLFDQAHPLSIFDKLRLFENQKFICVVNGRMHAWLHHQFLIFNF